jgi:CRP-like cAMP-binding protein
VRLYSVLRQLPKGLQSEIVQKINGKFVATVKLFRQTQDPTMVTDLLIHMQPVMFIAGDYVVRKGEVANTMYFVREGVVKAVCADNEDVPISYMGRGCYFGEIGVLLSGTRSLSVVAETDCLLYEVEKKDLIHVLHKHPSLRLMLESIGKQRLETTQWRDITLRESDSRRNSLNRGSQDTQSERPSGLFHEGSW